jgi:hypothetical protein
VLTSLAEEKRRLGDELAALPTETIIELHPKAIERYLDVVQNLAASLSCRVVGGDEQIASALRELVEAVVVHPGHGEPELEIRGRLAAPTGDPLFPQRLSGPRHRFHFWNRCLRVGQFERPER